MVEGPPGGRPENPPANSLSGAMRKLSLLFLDFQIPYLLKDAEYPVGGASVRQLALARGLSSLGHRVGIITWKGARRYVGEDQSFEFVESYAPDAGPRKLRFFFYRYPSLLRAAKAYGPDFIFQKCFGAETATIWTIARLFKVPFIYMAGNDIDADGGYRQRLGRLESAAYEYALRNAAGVIAQNEYQLRGFRKWLKGKSIAVVHNPVSFDGDSLLRIRTRGERGYIAWLGIFQPQKNLAALLEIAKRTPEVEFRVGGMLQTGSGQALRDLVGKLYSLPNVRMAGYLRRREILPFLAKALALLNTSYYEGFSNTFLEAWLAGTPVITRSIDPDGVIAGNGIGSVAGSYDEVPGIIRSLMNEDGYDALAEKCRAYVLENHDERVIAERFIAALPRKGL